MACADSDIGISKDTNQDSLIIKHATTDIGEVLLAAVCDGMGGLKKGEVASATVVKALDDWFDNELPYELKNIDMNVIGSQLSLLLKELNAKILEHSQNNNIEGMGTTVSCILFIDNQYVICHVGDTRIYSIESSLEQLTTDQTFIAREINKGSITSEQAKNDKRRNLLLQCVGASKVLEPQIISGKVKSNAYMLCSDGFRHKISEKEIFESFNSMNLMNKETMHNNARHLIDQVKTRNEKDNISVIFIKVE